MSDNRLNRRDFERLSSAALAGLLAAGLPGCSNDAASPPGGAPPMTGEHADAAAADKPTAADKPAAGEDDLALMLEEPHVCRGLNVCKGHGAGKENACAGQGTCATVVGHDCATSNECKGQGGCGGKEGTNSCKGQGGCHVPLQHGWEAVRAKFEKAMKQAGKEVGPAPAPTTPA